MTTTQQNFHLDRCIEVSIRGSSGVHRRDFLHGVSAAAMATGMLSWTDLLVVEASRLRKRGMACILLWMKGGPSQFETFSPTPDHDNGGETQAINTSVAGIQLAENLPETARMMNDICVIRSMTSKERSHRRASFLLHTGYIPTPSLRHPSFGSIVTQQLGDPTQNLPGFVRIGAEGRGATGAGFLGVKFDPFVMRRADRTPNNTKLLTQSPRFRRRMNLLDQLGTRAGTAAMEAQAAVHRELYERAANLVLSPDMSAFDIQQETASVRRAYGETKFGQGCLLARRLVESGVTFVEVIHGNWDTHLDNFSRSRKLCAALDQPYAQLLGDLKQRGMLDRTLVVWMGEFGRTPRINPRAGRDHYSRAFSVALAGGGVRGGQVIGRTDAGGAEVTERPVGVSDLFQTFCHSLRIDASHENMSPVGRPIKIVEGGEAVREAFA